MAAIKTTATRKGNKYVLNGEKAYISQVKESQSRGGGHSSLVLTDPSKGLKGGMSMMAIMPNQLKGMTSTTYKDMGRMGLSTGGFVYKNSEIDARYLIGQEGKGFYLCMEGFNPARALVASACLGAAERCLEIAADYAKQRYAFGQPISKFQGVNFMLADKYQELDVTKLNLQRGCWMIDKYYEEPGSFTQKQINVVIAECKLVAPILSVEIIKQAIMTLGAFGYTKESPLEMAMRGVMSYVSGAEGSMNIMRTIINRDVFGPEFK